MSRHRRKRRSKRIAKKRATNILLAGMALVMLVFTLVLVIPVASHQNISLPTACGFALLMWAASVFALWACLRSRRRKYSSDRARYTTHTDYSDSEFDDDPLPDGPPATSSKSDH